MPLTAEEKQEIRGWVEEFPNNELAHLIIAHLVFFDLEKGGQETRKHISIEGIIKKIAKTRQKLKRQTGGYIDYVKAGFIDPVQLRKTAVAGSIAHEGDEEVPLEVAMIALEDMASSFLTSPNNNLAYTLWIRDPLDVDYIDPATRGFKLNLPKEGEKNVVRSLFKMKTKELDPVRAVEVLVTTLEMNDIVDADAVNELLRWAASYDFLDPQAGVPPFDFSGGHLHLSYHPMDLMGGVVSSYGFDLVVTDNTKNEFVQRQEQERINEIKGAQKFLLHHAFADKAKTRTHIVRSFFSVEKLQKGMAIEDLFKSFPQDSWLVPIEELYDLLGGKANATVMITEQDKTTMRWEFPANGFVVKVETKKTAGEQGLTGRSEEITSIDSVTIEPNSELLSAACETRELEIGREFFLAVRFFLDKEGQITEKMIADDVVEDRPRLAQGMGEEALRQRIHELFEEKLVSKGFVAYVDEQFKAWEEAIPVVDGHKVYRGNADGTFNQSWFIFKEAEILSEKVKLKAVASVVEEKSEPVLKFTISLSK